MNISRTASLLVIAFVLSAAMVNRAQAQMISEPYTVFYGKVLGTASAQNFLITTGQLAWTIQRADGVSVTLKTSLYSFHNGVFSYRLNVPHSAFALGLDAQPGGIPLPPIPQVNVHATVKVDGQTATLLGPAGTAFTTEQLLRTSTYRMDLGLHRAAVDTDGDGIPDWWEEQYGLDKQNPLDAAQDLSGDGRSALYAYLNGLDPTIDARHPQLLTEEVIVYLSGTTGILLDTADLDSTSAQLVYTLKSLPHAGTLRLRNVYSNPGAPDAALDAGSQFTQADLRQGRLIYDHDGSSADPGFFDVEVRDENPNHASSTGTIHLLAYEPADLIPENLTALESQRLDNHFYAGLGYVILDGSSASSNVVLTTPSAGLTGPTLLAYETSYGIDRSYMLLAGNGSSSALTGGQSGDVLVAGQNGGSLTGGLGDDWFVITSFNKGKVTVTDFSPAEQDVVDMSRIPATPGAYAHLYLRIAKTAGVHQVQTDLKGMGTGFTNITVVLPGLTDSQADLYTLVDSGRLLIGALQLEPHISVAATLPQASENGPTAGQFTLTRQGSLVGNLSVNVVLSGAAQNGVDYQFIPSTILIPAGVASVNVPVTPFVDGITEPTESVQLLVTTGIGYRVSSANQAIVTIDDLLMLVEIEAVDPIAVKDTLTPGLFMITRRDVINRDVVVRLTISGTAANGTDYHSLSTLVYMAPNQTVAFLQVMPKATAQLAGGLETVTITVRTDVNYRVISGAGVAQVVIIERNESFAGWRAREFPDATGDATTFAFGDSGNTGVSHLQRYAFGLDPHNPDRLDLPRPLILDGKLVVTFRKPISVNDVQYRVVGSGDLLQWTNHAVTITPIANPAGTSDPGRVYYQAAESGDTSFIVVEVEWLP